MARRGVFRKERFYVPLFRRGLYRDEGTTSEGEGGTTYFQTVSGGFAPSASIVRETQKVVAGAVTPSGVITHQGTYGRALAGALTPSGVIIKRTMKAFAGALAPAGAIMKETQKVVAGNVEPTGDFTKETQKVVAGGITPSGAWSFGYLFSQVAAGTVTPTGALTSLYIEFVPSVFARFRRLTNVITGGLRHRR